MNEWNELLRKNDYIGVKKYIKNGADINAANDNGESVLYIAMKEHCDEDLVKLIIDNGADIFDFDEEGVSIFDIAITYNYIEIVKYIILNNININKTKRKSGFTPLMAATCYGRVEIVKILLEEGADKSLCDLKGFKAVDFARKMNKKTILKLLDYDESSPKNTNYAR